MTVHQHSLRPYGFTTALSERRAALTPRRVGLVDATTGTEYTYAEVDRRANRTARALRQRGVREDDRVAVISRNRPAVVDCYFATAKLGAVLSPLSHRLAPVELAALLDDIEPTVVLVEARFGERLEAALSDDAFTRDRPTLVVLTSARSSVEDSSQAEPSDESHAEQDSEGSVALEGFSSQRSQLSVYEECLPEDDSPIEGVERSLADPQLFLHTGGSTGLPKVAVQTYGSVAWNAFNTIITWGLRPTDTTPMLFPFFHTGGWNVLTIPLFHIGGTVIISREVDPGETLSLIEAYDTSVLVAVPAVLRFMVEHPDWTNADLSSLRFVKSGGGPCREGIIDAWTERGCTISQGYGLTECGPNNFAMPEAFSREKTESIGIPCLYVDARIVDGEREELPPGEVGELELASPHTAARYWRNEPEPAQTFGPRTRGKDSESDHVETPDGKREKAWVSTGDLARVDGDGYFYIEGRKKNMFVSGGENVYPPEVEAVITEHPAVGEAVVIPVSDPKWGQVGKAVIESDEDLTLDELRAFMDGKIARYKLPRKLIRVEEIPTSGVSKLDRVAVAERFGESKQ